MIRVQPPAHIHMMGICGTAMGGLAGLLKNLGYHVTGSDQNVYPPMSTQLAQLGIPIMNGYKRENLSPRPDFVIVGNVMSRHHEEVQALLETDIPYASLPEAIGELVIQDRDSLVVAGTHGKTTTTSLLAWVAECCGKEPGFLIGGRPKDFEMSFRLPQAKTFVIEGDEYDTAFFAKVPKFVYYRPKFAVLTSVEFDHADIYKDLDDVKRAFIKLLELIPDSGGLIFWAEDKNIEDLLSHQKKGVQLGYGFDRGDFQIRNLELVPEFSAFDIYWKGKKEDRVETRLFGRHNILNTAAVYALCRHLGWDRASVLEGMRSFSGVRRRQDVFGVRRGITLIDDFAHHPTAVRVTLEGIRERYANGRLFAVFEPRSATSRRKVFQKDYLRAFSGPWEVLLANPFKSESLPESERFSSESLVQQLQETGTVAALYPSADQIVADLKARARSGDVIVIMSNGGFDGIYDKLSETLE